MRVRREEKPMIRGLYMAGTGMLTQRQQMDVVTNNIANTDTVGYRSDKMISRSFEDMLIDRVNDPSVINQTTTVGPLGPGVHIDEIITSFNQGIMEMTGRDSDLALEGPGFFEVDAGDGTMLYTRAGNFSIDFEGFLVDVDGRYVQGEGGEIQLTSDKFTILSSGEVYDDATDTLVDTLRVVEFETPGNLRKEGNNLFSVYEDAGEMEAENTKVMQGYIETSNVNIAQEMVNMIITNRAYDANQQIVSMTDSTLERAVNDIARF